MSENEILDVVVVGGGAAGLSGALALSRARRSVLVVDAGEPRNAPAGHVHNYLGREGTPPGELLAIGRAEVASYGGRVEAGRVVSARTWDRDGTGFVVTLEDGRELRPGGCWSRPGWSTSCPTCPGCASGGATTSCTVPTATAGRCATRRSGVLCERRVRGAPGAAVPAVERRRGAVPRRSAGARGRGRGAAGRARDPGRRRRRSSELVVEDDEVVGLRLAGGEVVARRAVVVAPRFEARSRCWRRSG